MKHTITMIYTVEAPSWGEALENVLRHLGEDVSGCKVKSPGARLLHVAPGSLDQAREQIKKEERDE